MALRDFWQAIFGWLAYLLGERAEAQSEKEKTLEADDAAAHRAIVIEAEVAAADQLTAVREVEGKRDAKEAADGPVAEPIRAALRRLRQ